MRCAVSTSVRHMLFAGTLAFPLLSSTINAADQRLDAVTLTPSTEAVNFFYPPYAFGPYAEGQYAVFVAWDPLKPYRSPERRQIFGGQRPKSEDNTQQ